MAQGRYFLRRGDQEFAEVSEMFPGVHILKVENFSTLGKPINIYTAQWINSQSEDYMVTTKETVGDVDYDVIIRENEDIAVTFIVSDKEDTEGHFDVRKAHDAFVAYMTDGALYIKSDYADRTLRCVCLEKYEPTYVKLKRPNRQNRMLGTLELHCLDVRAGNDDGFVGNPYKTASSEEDGGGGTTLQVSAANVYDTALGATQAQLNQEFSKTRGVSVEVVGTTLKITTI